MTRYANLELINLRSPRHNAIPLAAFEAEYKRNTERKANENRRFFRHIGRYYIYTIQQ